MYTIPFAGLKEGKHQFEYIINKTFFDSFPYDEILDSNLKVDLEFVKKTTLLELCFSANGQVEVACDVTNEPYNENITTKFNLVVKFGDFYNDENEDILIIPHTAYELDVSQFIYEMTVLALPAKKVHPGIEDGTLESDILKKLEELQPKENKTSQETDPRWSKLKDLLNE